MFRLIAHLRIEALAIAGQNELVANWRPAQMDASDKKRIFFISYNAADRSWAEWIGWQLEEAGYSVIIQAWDFRPGANFALKMDEAARTAERTIIVLSPNFLASSFTPAEWGDCLRPRP